MKRLKTRQQEGIVFGVLLLLSAAVFTLWPGIDLAAAGLFYRDGVFVGNAWTFSWVIYKGFPWAGAALVAWSLYELLRARTSRRPPAPRVRRAGMLLLVAVLGVWLAVHVGLKDNWGRPRPAQVELFKGRSIFQPALHPSTQCPANCSFTSGHVAGGAALLALGLFGTRRTRWRWWSVGAVLSLVIGFARMSTGSHFASDVVFAFLVVWGTGLLVRECWLRVVLRRRARLRAVAV